MLFINALASCACPLAIVGIVTAIIVWPSRDRIRSIKAGFSGFEVRFDKSGK